MCTRIIARRRKNGWHKSHDLFRRYISPSHSSRLMRFAPNTQSSWTTIRIHRSRRNLRLSAVTTRSVIAQRKNLDDKMDLYKHIRKEDPEIFAALDGEEKRQAEGLELIPSENYVSRAVKGAMGSSLTNKYSEGYPGKRYYGGQEFTDKVETLAIERAKKLFG